jgi:hypothetical protein
MMLFLVLRPPSSGDATALNEYFASLAEFLKLCLNNIGLSTRLRRASLVLFALSTRGDATLAADGKSFQVWPHLVTRRDTRTVLVRE